MYSRYFQLKGSWLRFGAISWYEKLLLLLSNVLIFWNNVISSSSTHWHGQLLGTGILPGKGLGHSPPPCPNAGWGLKNMTFAYIIFYFQIIIIRPTKDQFSTDDQFSLTYNAGFLWVWWLPKSILKNDNVLLKLFLFCLLIVLNIDIFVFFDILIVFYYIFKDFDVIFSIFLLNY